MIRWNNVAWSWECEEHPELPHPTSSQEIRQHAWDAHGFIIGPGIVNNRAGVRYEGRPRPAMR